MNYSLFFCEGLLDSYLLFRILKQDFGFKEMKVSQIQNLSFTKLAGDSKTFYCGNGMHTVSILQCGNKDKTLKNADFIFNKNIKADRFPLYSLGLFIDMNDMAYDSINQKINHYLTFKTESICIGNICNDPVKFGVWAFPDCRQSGAVERLLISFYRLRFGDLMTAADRYIHEQTPGRYRLNWNERRIDKALLSSAASVLQESGRVTDSIAADPWYPDQKPAEMTPFFTFIQNLLEN